MLGTAVKVTFLYGPLLIDIQVLTIQQKLTFIRSLGTLTTDESTYQEHWIDTL